MAAGASRTLELKLVGNAKQLNSTLSATEKKVGGFGEKLTAFGTKAAKAFAVGAAAAGAFAIKLSVDAIKAASDLNEEVSKSRVIFGDAAAAVEEFAGQAARTLGQSKTQALAAAANFGIFGKSAGLSGPALSEFSTRLVTLASDLASFNNASPEETIFAIGAALRGESEPIRRYGVLLNDATLKARAMEMGLYDGVGALDQQAKVLAAYQEVLAQTGDAQGDFARTADGLANQQRILAATYDDLKAKLGDALLPVANDFLAWILDLTPSIEAAIPKVQDFMLATIERAREIKDALATVLVPLADWARGFAEDAAPGFIRGLEHIREAWAPFVENLKAGYDDLSGGLHTLADAFGFELGSIGEAFGRLAEYIGRNIRDILTGFGNIARAAGAFFGPFAEDIAARFRGAEAAVEAVRAGTYAGDAGMTGFEQYGFKNEQLADLPGFLQPTAAFLRTFTGEVPRIYGGYRGESAYTPGASMNVRIEGLVVDPEGTARAIERLLDDRRRRMGPRVTAGAFG